MSKGRCLECEEVTRKLYIDPRDPPLDSNPCLCRTCRDVALHDLIDEAQFNIAMWRAMIKQKGGV